MHRLSAGFFLGYHGCRKVVGERLLAGEPFKPSDNEWDWLGPGAYFWDANPQRALDWAHAQYGEGNGFAVGAVIDPGLCLDLTTASGLALVRDAFDDLERTVQLAHAPMPKNTARGVTDDSVVRRLDCAVIRMVHELVLKAEAPAIDTVRGVFVEGGPLYPGGDIQSLTHIQYAVRNLECIKGVFRVTAFA